MTKWVSFLKPSLREGCIPKFQRKFTKHGERPRPGGIPHLLSASGREPTTRAVRRDAPVRTVDRDTAEGVPVRTVDRDTTEGPPVRTVDRDTVEGVCSPLWN